MTGSLEWIAADWGTTNLRLWAMRGRQVVDKRTSQSGMSRLEPHQFAPLLERMVADWGPAPVVACGMVGSRQGWVEAPYRATPAAIQPELVKVPASARPVWIAGGIKQFSPPDVMRGEETQIAGVLDENPDFDGVFCLPGTHTKWVRVKKRQIHSFQSFMTGELFELISERSVLRHTLATHGTDLDALAAAADQAIDDPAAAYGRFFQLRAAALLGAENPLHARSTLSGLLIGLELSAASRFWHNDPVILLGGKTLAPLYERVLGKRARDLRPHDAEQATLSGLAMAWEQVREIA